MLTGWLFTAVFSIAGKRVVFWPNEIVFPADCSRENNHEFLIPFQELENGCYCMFLMSPIEQVRFLAGAWDQEAKGNTFIYVYEGEQDEWE